MIVVVTNVKILVCSNQIGVGLILMIVISLLLYALVEIALYYMFPYSPHNTTSLLMLYFPAVYFAFWFFVIGFGLSDVTIFGMKRVLSARKLRLIEDKERA